MLSTEINGSNYELSTKLRVAYEIQGCHNHKPYAEVFKGVGEMSIEEQIEILFVAFKIANPDVATTFNKKMFQEYYLENYKLKDVMEQLKGVINGIMGEEEEETKGN